MLAAAVAALVLKGPSDVDLPMLATKAQFDRWVKGFYHKQIFQMKDRQRSFVVLGAEVGSGMPVIMVRIFEKIGMGYLTRCVADRTGYDRIVASIPPHTHSVRVDGLLSWPSPSGMRRKGLLVEYGL